MKKAVILATATALMLAGVAISEATAGAESKCKTCHTFDKDGKNRMGPNLFGIVGKKAGSVEDYRYGTYLKESDFTWNEENLKAWIEDSKTVAKAAGKITKMPSQHVADARADEIIAFLKTAK
ncbi:MAG: cytochrome C [Zetaproteobacteria bacterium CG12_big_fil_rev_8_21_14_0_65_54_13]|nr:MAG: cytochrome C [Zetaproteobacteria bacterium CG23_combo_of_CG06-09_8_20_14_all_54_7]PIW50781.1 MAG: cytochrome C [Zetaproteobacteria bacterium CG12_big_fil_rev_8_21_14_0_65_54_13]PIX54294.1 MAG: cytochrome C [Zetaproteobacteria bacterium CG_4_10_14_3_um_filter_54_28]PJA29920.1 MAG: cytochrome C [Zetaproteobacteria bacterium CG_4_9_14_3_um_filter_54_145]